MKEQNTAPTGATGSDAAAPEQHIPANFTTHRAAWRDAITQCMNAETNAGRPDAAAYWKHELAAYDRAFARLLDKPEPVRAAAPAPTDAMRRALDAIANQGMDARQCMETARAALASQSAPEQPALTVWEGPMPESNGKSNFTAVLVRKDAKGFDMFDNGFTISRSEYPDRVRYEADRVRYLIGELDEPPLILDYDAKKHSGYAPPAADPADTLQAHAQAEGETATIKTGEAASTTFPLEHKQ